MERERPPFGLIGLAVVVALVLIVLFSSFGTVAAGERGVKTRFGAVVGVLDTGLYFKAPFVEKVTKIDVKTRTVAFDNKKDSGDASEYSSLAAASSDLQDVAIATVVNYHVDPNKVSEVFSQYGSSYEGSVLEPIIRDTVKSVASQYTAEELVTHRGEYADKVTALLGERMATKGALLERVNIVNFEFPAQFSKAIEDKVTAVQQAEAAKNKLEQVKFEQQAQIEVAKAEAETIRIKAQAVTQQGGKDYVQLQAIDKWDGHLPTQMIPGSAVPFINLTK